MQNNILEYLERTVLRVPEKVAFFNEETGLTFRQVAAIAERPLGTVLWQYRKAIEKLRNRLDGGCL